MYFFPAKIIFFTLFSTSKRTVNKLQPKRIYTKYLSHKKKSLENKSYTHHQLNGHAMSYFQVMTFIQMARVLTRDFQLIIDLDFGQHYPLDHYSVDKYQENLIALSTEWKFIPWIVLTNLLTTEACIICKKHMVTHIVLFQRNLFITSW